MNIIQKIEMIVGGLIFFGMVVVYIITGFFTFIPGIKQFNTWLGSKVND